MARIIQFYRTEDNRCPVNEFLKGLDDRTLGKVLAVFKLIETQNQVPTQYFKKLSGHDIWECRAGLGGRIYRFLAFWDQGSVIIVTHGFEKKSQKTPQQEIAKALSYKAEWQGRNK